MKLGKTFYRFTSDSTELHKISFVVVERFQSVRKSVAIGNSFLRFPSSFSSNFEVDVINILGRPLAIIGGFGRLFQFQTCYGGYSRHQV